MSRLIWTDEKIIEYIEEEGYKFIRFIDEKDGVVYNKKGYGRRIEIWCGNPNHKPYDVRFGNFKGKLKRRCPYCNGGIKYTYDYIKNYVESFGYTLLSKEYINCKETIIVQCDKGHKPYETTFDNFTQCKCSKCGHEYVASLKRKTLEQFKTELLLKNKDVEIIGNEYKNEDEKIECRCKVNKEHLWKATPHNLLKGSGCPYCKKSKGEERIKQELINRNIIFKEEYEFDDCIYRKTLPFDFYLPQYNICIEYDGQQHYQIIETFGGLDRFIDQKIRDTIKNIYCQQNNIKLIRIPYWDFDRIEEILEFEII